jgi:hypothetical protein
MNGIWACLADIARGAGFRIMTTATEVGMARVLIGRMDRLRMHPDAGLWLVQLEQAVERATAAIDRPAEKWYAGMCGGVAFMASGLTGVCAAELYAKHDQMVITCPRCGAVYDVAERRAYLLSQVEDVLATATEVGRALTQYAGESVTPVRVRVLKHRGKIVAHGVNNKGEPMYRIGDVLKAIKRAER